MIKNKVLLVIFASVLVFVGVRNVSANYNSTNINVSDLEGFNTLYTVSNSNISTIPADYDNWLTYFDSVKAAFNVKTNIIVDIDNPYVLAGYFYSNWYGGYTPRSVIFCGDDDIVVNTSLNSMTCTNAFYITRNGDTQVTVAYYYNDNPSYIFGPYSTFYNSPYVFTSSSNVLDNSSYFASSYPNTDLIEIPVDTSIIYDDNLLDDDNRFQKVCVNGMNTSFSVIPSDLSNIDTTQNSSVSNNFLSDYYLRNFDINLLTFNNNGVDNYHIEQVAPSFYYYEFSDEESITNFTTNPMYSVFNTLYSNLYKKLYGWDLFNASFVYNYTDNVFMLPVYRLNNAYKENPFCTVIGGSTVCTDSEGNTHGGGGRDHGDTVVRPNDEFCFYIPTTYTIKIWDVNEFNDIDDSITINNTDFNISTNSYELAYIEGINNNSYSGYIGYFKSVMQTLSIPLAFISSKITKLFNVLPLPVQYLIIGVIALGFLIGLVKFLTGGK